MNSSLKRLFVIAVIGLLLGGIAMIPLYADRKSDAYAATRSAAKSKTYAAAEADGKDFFYAGAYARQIVEGKSKTYAHEYAEAYSKMATEVYSKTVTEAIGDVIVDGTSGKLSAAAYIDVYASAYAREIADGGNEIDARYAAVLAASRAVAEAE